MSGLRWARQVAVVGIAVAVLGTSALGAQRNRDRNSAPAAQNDSGRQTKARPAEEVNKQLRADWKMGDLKLTRDAVDEANFTPDIKKKALEAVDWFLAQQEGLLAKAGQSPQAEADVRKQQPVLEKEFQQRMQVVYGDEKLMAELGRSLRALNKEMDNIAQGADSMFAKLDSVGLTPQQKAKLQPVIKDANEQMKKVVDKSQTRSTKDKLARDEVVTKYRDARSKVRQQLTPEQREKLKQKMAEEP